jgi:hypothetical protein
MSLQKILFLLILSISFTLHAQLGDNGSLLKINLVPPSPEAASLGKYGETPVSLYTGLPNISIPIFNMNGRRLNTSLSLSYHAGGLKVEETSSRVGLGWSLSAGGLITRTVRGIADDSPNGWLTNGFTYAAFLAQTASQRNITSENIANGNLDAETDLYYYNFNGQSGKFYLDDQRNIVTIPYTKLRIEFTQTSGLITQWIITDEMGNVNYFGRSKDNLTNSRETTTSVSGCGSQIPPTQVSTSAWNLLETFDLNNEDTISFRYEPYLINQCMNTTATKYLPIPSGSAAECNGKSDMNCYSFTTTDGQRIQSIISSKNKVEFMYGASRVDLPGDHVLEKIVIKSHNGLQLKQIEFKYDYFTSTGTLTSNPYCSASTERTKRLKLLSVQEKSELETIPPYTFKYEIQDLPERLSYGQDYWGFSNGVTTNITPVPAFEYHNGSTHFYLQGANKEVNVTHAKANMLNSITYPTGARTEFEYELNTAISTYLPYQKEFKISPTINGNGATTSYSIPFTVNSFGQPGAFLIRRISGITCSLTEITCGVAFTVQGVTNPAFLLNVNNVPTHFYLPNGDYTYNVTLNPLSDDNKYFSTNLEWAQHLSVENKPAGGLRIKSIVNKEGENITNSKYFFYTKPNTSETSGSIPSHFKYEYPVVEYSRDGIEGMPITVYYTCSYIARSSISKIPLATTQGSSVGYATVTEQEDLGALKGKTVYTYISPSGLPDVFFDTYPFASPQSKDWLRGLLLSKRIYKYGLGGHLLIAKEANEYEDLNAPQFLADGLTVGYSPNITFPSPKGFIYQVSTTQTGIRRLKRNTKVEYIYSSSNVLQDSLVAVTKFVYGNSSHLQKTRSILYSSGGDSLVTIYKYAHDLGESTIKTELLSKNLISLPIEEYVKTGANNKIKSGKKDEYSIEAAKLRRKNIWLTEFSNNQGVDETAISSIPFIKRASYHSYDNYGNVTSYSKEQDTYESYLWGYNNSVPIAKIVNASPGNAFFTSFEEDGNSLDGESKAGLKSWNGNFQKNLTGLTNGNYTLSFWIKSGINWINTTQVVTVVNGTYTISISGQVDEVRFQPINSQMTTYTYAKDNLIYAIADPNGRFTYYWYDDLHRLSTVVDESGNVLRKIEYNYKDPSSN